MIIYEIYWLSTTMLYQWRLCIYYCSCSFQLQNVATGDLDSDWPGAVADYIRNNDEAVLRGTDRLLSSYQNDFLTSASFDEFCDVTGKLTYIQPSLKSPLTSEIYVAQYLNWNFLSWQACWKIYHPPRSLSTTYFRECLD